MTPEHEDRIRERAQASTFVTTPIVPGFVVDNLDLARADRRTLLMAIDNLRLDLFDARDRLRMLDDDAEARGRRTAERFALMGRIADF